MLRLVVKLTQFLPGYGNQEQQTGDEVLGE